MRLKYRILFLSFVLSVAFFASINAGEDIVETNVKLKDCRYVINCDSIYPQKGYRIGLNSFDTENREADIYNTLFVFLREADRDNKILFSDSIYTMIDEIRFEDFNGDGLSDIMVYHDSDVRSNSMYYLYLMDTIDNRLVKIKGFEKIKNPTYLQEYDLISNYVVSGRNWSSFYKISGDSIIDLNILIYDDQSGDEI